MIGHAARLLTRLVRRVLGTPRKARRAPAAKRGRRLEIEHLESRDLLNAYSLGLQGVTQSALENQPNVQIQMQINPAIAPGDTLTVHYRTVAGSAVPGRDYGSSGSSAE